MLSPAALASLRIAGRSAGCTAGAAKESSLEHVF